MAGSRRAPNRLFVRRTPLPTTRTLPSPRVRRVTMRSASPSFWVRRTMPSSRYRGMAPLSPTGGRTQGGGAVLTASTTVRAHDGLATGPRGRRPARREPHGTEAVGSRLRGDGGRAVPARLLRAHHRHPRGRPAHRPPACAPPRVPGRHG